MSTSEYNVIHSEARTVKTAASDLMEEIFALSLEKDTEKNLVAFCDTIKTSSDQIVQSASKLDDIAEQDCDCDCDLNQGRSNYQSIDTGNGNISWSAENLLDQQVMEALAELISKYGPLKVLQLIQNTP